MAFFQANVVLLAATILAGLLSVLTPISIVAGAILLNRVLHFSGAEAVLSQWLKSISTNKVAQLMIIGWAFAFMIEGASGFGTPAAIAAPILVGLGFPAIPVAIFTLAMNFCASVFWGRWHAYLVRFIWFVFVRCAADGHRHANGFAE